VNHVTIGTPAGPARLYSSDIAHVIYDKGLPLFDGDDVAPGAELLDRNGALRFFISRHTINPTRPAGRMMAFLNDVPPGSTATFDLCYLTGGLIWVGGA
jgi:hypothetical protein